MSTDGDRTDDDTYELDLDETGSGSVDRVMEEAVAAVEQHAASRESAEAADGDADSAAGSAPADPPAAREVSAEDEPLRERLLRTLADFDNFRKRTEREKSDLRRYAVADLLKDFLGVVDNLERALGSAGGIDDLKQGVDMILRQQLELMRRYGVRRVEADGQPFDPTVHEAVMRQESAEVAEPTVLQELQSGYMLHDRLLRPAMVSVAMPSAPAKSRTGTGEEDGDAN
ncbi:MAG: nucleotide exchange factor GrpE [Acidobacteriota bacterium]